MYLQDTLWGFTRILKSPIGIFWRVTSSFDFIRPFVNNRSVFVSSSCCYIRWQKRDFPISNTIFKTWHIYTVMTKNIGTRHFCHIIHLFTKKMFAITNGYFFFCIGMTQNGGEKKSQIWHIPHKVPRMDPTILLSPSKNCKK